MGLILLRYAPADKWENGVNPPALRSGGQVGKSTYAPMDIQSSANKWG
ncbi:MAG TPA: hypothetical protein VI731_07820 [Bacteroidia bacterium]|nr:hypothetical protein [Bacteroidia bacterium]